MYPDFKELLSVFNAHSVKYLIVDGYAVSLHAQPRATKDIDILVRPDLENANALYAALASFGAPLQGFVPKDFAEQGSFFRMGREPLAVDILSAIPGVEFDAAWERRNPRLRGPSAVTKTPTFLPQIQLHRPVASPRIARRRTE